MLVTFKTKYYSNITFLGDIAKDLLKAMGQSGAVPGAIAPEDVSDVLGSLRKNLEADSGKAGGGDDSEDKPVISLQKRAMPLVELLESAVKEKEHVTWES